MLKTARAIAFGAGMLATTVAGAESAADYRLRSGATLLEARHALVPKLDGQREALGNGEIRVLCFVEVDALALVLRIDQKFDALNGTARDAAASAQIDWRGKRHDIVDPYRIKLTEADYMSKMIGPSGRECRK
jgi:hypothetical protein